MKKKVKYTKTPKGETKRIIYREGGKQPVCERCGQKLPGVPKKTSSKTQRRPERKYSNLCSQCARERIKKEVVENIMKK
jgi:ribosomal protein L34E